MSPTVQKNRRVTLDARVACIICSRGSLIKKKKKTTSRENDGYTRVQRKFTKTREDKNLWRQVQILEKRVNHSHLMSSSVGTLSPMTRSTSSWAFRTTSGCCAISKKAHVNTAAVVSCPAMSIVMRSSRS